VQYHGVQATLQDRSDTEEQCLVLPAEDPHFCGCLKQGKIKGERSQHVEKYEGNFPLVETVKNFYIIVKSMIWCYPQLGV
jgi:hypothetical protein